MLKVEKGVPKWMNKWLKACKETILPEWDVTIEMGQTDPSDPSMVVAGSAHYQLEYLQVCIRLNPDLEDDYDGHQTIVHEFTHPLLSPYGEALDTIARVCTKGFCERDVEDLVPITQEIQRKADELVTTRTSRLLYEFIKTKYNFRETH